MNVSVLARQVEAIVRQAGDLLLSYRFKPLVRTEKKEAGFVTEADLAVENFLIEQLSKIEPGVGFFAEENGEIASDTSDYCWVIDPLDGTTNFAYGLPHFCISVALTYQDRPVLGVVYQPLLREMFIAESGKGSFLNGSSVTISTVRRIEDSLLIFCIPYGKNEVARNFFEKSVQLGQESYSMRLLGAAALDQAYTASGRVDGMFLEQLSWWDIAAGLLIIQEAGGIVSDYCGEPLKPGFASFVAGNSWIHEQLMRKLSRGN